MTSQLGRVLTNEIPATTERPRETVAGRLLADNDHGLFNTIIIGCILSVLGTIGGSAFFTVAFLLYAWSVNTTVFALLFTIGVTIVVGVVLIFLATTWHYIKKVTKDLRGSYH